MRCSEYCMHICYTYHIILKVALFEYRVVGYGWSFLLLLSVNHRISGEEQNQFCQNDVLLYNVQYYRKDAQLFYFQIQFYWVKKYQYQNKSFFISDLYQNNIFTKLAHTVDLFPTTFLRVKTIPSKDRLLSWFRGL